MTFRILPLSREPFAALFALDDETLAARGVRRMPVTSDFGFPCRVGLRDLAPGQTALLLNHEHQPAATPFRSSHAIFVGEQSVESSPARGDIPEVLARRTLSIRAFDAEGMMVDADICEGAEAAGLIERMLAAPGAVEAHIHAARRGCYMARAVRA